MTPSGTSLANKRLKIQADGAIRGPVEVSFVLFMLHGTLAPLLNLAVGQAQMNVFRQLKA